MIKATRETPTGRNTHFVNTSTGRHMNREQLVTSIRKGTYSGYHIRMIHGIATPVSNPDGKTNNNID